MATEVTQPETDSSSSTGDKKPEASADNNFKLKGAGCDVWGPQRLAMAKLLRDSVLPAAAPDVPWIIESGTLLGAWRSKKFIPHDDDFDIALLFDATATEAVSALKDMLPKIKAALPSQYDCRLVDTYADKIEVFEPAHGSYILPGPQYNGADYFYVIVDLQAYYLDDGIYKSCYRAGTVYNYKKSDVLPLSSIELEGETFSAPANVKAALEGVYGSLEAGAKYNPKTGKYEVPAASSGDDSHPSKKAKTE